MSFQSHINRPLVTKKKRKPRNKTNQKFRPRAEVKTENIQSVISVSNILPSRIKTEYCDISTINSEFGNISSIQGNQETGSILDTMIKTEYIEENVASSATIKPISTENINVPPSINQEMQKKELNDTGMVYKCCNIKFTDKFQHFQHMIYHTEEIIRSSELKNIQCHYCDRHCKTESGMMSHLQSVHIGFQCIHCLCNFSRKAMLLRHLQVAHNITKIRKYKRYPQTNDSQWRKSKKWYKSKSVKKIKKEKDDCTSDIEIIPDIANVKMEFNPTNIKTEPLANIKEETMPTIKIEINSE